MYVAALSRFVLNTKSLYIYISPAVRYLSILELELVSWTLTLIRAHIQPTFMEMIYQVKVEENVISFIASIQKRFVKS